MHTLVRCYIGHRGVELQGFWCICSMCRHRTRKANTLVRCKRKYSLVA